MKTSKMAKNAAMLVGMSLIFRMVQMSFQIYLSNLLGASNMGLLQLILSINALAITLSLSGVRAAVVRLCAEEEGRGVSKAVRACMTYALVISTLVSVLMMYLKEPLALQVTGDISAAFSLELLAYGLPFTACSAVLTGYFMARGRIGRYTISEFLERGFEILITVAFMSGVFGAQFSGIPGICIGGSLGSVVSCIVKGSFYLFDQKERQGGQVRPVKKRMFKIAVPIALAEYARSALSAAENTLIPRALTQFGGTREDALATFGMIGGMVMPVIFFPAALMTSLAQLITPELAGARERGQNERVMRLIDRIFHFGFYYAIITMGVMYALSGSLGRIIYDSELIGTYIGVMSPLIFVIYLDALTDGMLRGMGEEVSCMRYNVETSALSALLVMILAPKYGIAGYIITISLVRTVNFFLSLNRLLTVSGYMLPKRLPVKGFLCMLLSVPFGLLIKRLLIGHGELLATVMQGLCMVLVYLIAVRAIERAEKRRKGAKPGGVGV